MKFIRRPSGDGAEQLLSLMEERLESGQFVLWLVSGGSNIAIAKQVMDMLSYELSANLTIMLSDERYGAVGHENSNLQQLQNASFDSKQAYFITVLQSGLSRAETVRSYSLRVNSSIEEADYIVAQLGIGEDGHIAGILPDSAAASSEELVAGYQADDFNRITLTFSALRMANCAFVFAYGPNKHSTLELLLSQTLPLTKQPAQVLRYISPTYIYNDQVGEG